MEDVKVNIKSKMSFLSFLNKDTITLSSSWKFTRTLSFFFQMFPFNLLKTFENLWSSDVFRRDQKETLRKRGLNSMVKDTIKRHLQRAEVYFPKKPFKTFLDKIKLTKTKI